MHNTHKWAGVVAVFSTIGAGLYTGCVGDEPASPQTQSDAGGDATSTGDAGGDAACGDTTNDSNNCGACGHACASGFSCTNSVCGNEPIEISAWGTKSPGSPPPWRDTVCALLASGDVYCWGWNDQGQIGISPATTNTPTPIKVPVIGPAVHVAVGGGHACAVMRADGAVWCWGENAYGQTGKIPIEAGVPEISAPVQANVRLGYRSVSARSQESCALDDAGLVSCWGYNQRGALGHVPGTDGDLSSFLSQCDFGQTSSGFCYNPVPEAVDAGGVTALAAYDNGLCTIDPTNQIQCWGDLGFNDNGATNTDNGGAPGDPLAVQIANGASALTGMTSLFAGRDTICATGSTPGRGYCWGQNQESQLGNNNPAPGQDWPPSAVAFGDSDASVAFTDIKQFAVGWMHVCALRSDGSVWCAGRDQEGECGVPISAATGTCADGFSGTACATTPVQVQGPGGSGTLSGVTAIGGGRGVTCAIVKADQGSSIYCWGANSGNELGHPVGSAGDQACSAGAGCMYNSVPTKVQNLP